MSLPGFPIADVPLETTAFERAVDLFRLEKRAGITVRSSGSSVDLSNRGLRAEKRLP